MIFFFFLATSFRKSAQLIISPYPLHPPLSHQHACPPSLHPQIFSSLFFSYLVYFTFFAEYIHYTHFQYNLSSILFHSNNLLHLRRETIRNMIQVILG